MSDPDFPYLQENQRIDFPDISRATPEGIVAVGANLSPGVLLSAYSQGVFPWYNEDEPILWWNPDPRCVLFPHKLHVAKRMERTLRGGRFIVKADTCFEEVIRTCAGIKRRDEKGTWINDEIIAGYCELHRLGWAHSFETYQIPVGETSADAAVLVGGLYGVSLGACFFGESMFSKVSDASKAAFITMARTLSAHKIQLIDCQMVTSHLLSLGAEEISRTDYMNLLQQFLDCPDLCGRWTEL